MADYYSPTVIQQTIPNTDMTPLERLLLMQVFDSELDGDGMYFFAEEAPAEMIWLSRRELESALAASQAIESEANPYVTEQLSQAPNDAPEIELNLSTRSWEWLFQDVVRRSATLTYIVAITAFTCSKMRPDGFGGMVVLITADDIRAKSTDALMYELIAEADYGPLGTAPGFGVHILLTLDEKQVREAVLDIIKAERNITRLAPEAITDDEIRKGCLVVVERTDRTKERETAVYRAAMAAIRLANLRSFGPG